MQAYVIHSSLQLKNNWDTFQKWWRKIWKSISCVGNTLMNMTLFASCRVGTSSFVSLTFLGWAVHFFLPFDLCHIIMTTDPMDPKAVKLPVVSLICSRVVLLQLHLPLILCIIQNCFPSSRLTSMMWDSLLPSFDIVAYCRLQLIIWEVD